MIDVGVMKLRHYRNPTCCLSEIDQARGLALQHRVWHRPLGRQDAASACSALPRRIASSSARKYEALPAMHRGTPRRYATLSSGAQYLNRRPSITSRLSDMLLTAAGTLRLCYHW
jgi:hypothetical protein